MIKTLETKEKKFILSRNYIGYLAYIYNNSPFVVPITYFYNEQQNNIICYSSNGHKINALRKNSATSICISNIDSVNDWKSIMVIGNFEEHFGSHAKALLHQFSLGVKDLILKKENRNLDFISQFSSKISNDDMPIVFTVSVDEITGRKRKL